MAVCDLCCHWLLWAMKLLLWCYSWLQTDNWVQKTLKDSVLIFHKIPVIEENLWNGDNYAEVQLLPIVDFWQGTGKDKVLFKGLALGVWPYSNDYMGNPSWTWCFSFFYLPFMVGEMQTWKCRPGRNCKPAQLEYIFKEL